MLTKKERRRFVEAHEVIFYHMLALIARYEILTRRLGAEDGRTLDRSTLDDIDHARQSIIDVEYMRGLGGLCDVEGFSIMAGLASSCLTLSEKIEEFFHENFGDCHVLEDDNAFSSN